MKVLYFILLFLEKNRIKIVGFICIYISHNFIIKNKNLIIFCNNSF